MKKSILLAIWAAFFTQSALTQKVLVAGTLYGGFSSAKGYEARLSSGLGVDLDLPLSEKVTLQARPALQFRGYNGNLGVTTVKATYLDIPLMFNFRPANARNHIFFGAGGYIGFGVAGKYKSNITGSSISEWQKIKFGESDTANRSPLDYGIALNAGGHWQGSNRFIRFGIQGQFGLKNVVPKSRQDEPNADAIKLRNFSLYVAIGLTKSK